MTLYFVPHDGDTIREITVHEITNPDSPVRGTWWLSREDAQSNILLRLGQDVAEAQARLAVAEDRYQRFIREEMGGRNHDRTA